MDILHVEVERYWRLEAISNERLICPIKEIELNELFKNKQVKTVLSSVYIMIRNIHSRSLKTPETQNQEQQLKRKKLTTRASWNFSVSSDSVGFRNLFISKNVVA